MRKWIADFSESDAPNVYLIRYDYEGACRGWARADFSGVLNALFDASYADAIGESADTLSIYLLTDLGALPVTVTQVASGDHVAVQLTYRVPGVRGKRANAMADQGTRRRVEI